MKGRSEELHPIDNTGALPLLDLDLDHALSVGLTVAEGEAAENRADPVTPQQIATALAFQRGYNWLCQRLGIGSTKARRLREEWEYPILAELNRLGFTICASAGNTSEE